MNQALDRETEFRFTEQDFQWLREKASAHSGIVLADAKRNMIYSRLSKRLRKLKLQSFAQYRVLLDAGDQREFSEFINAITTNLTAFFREVHHFEHLAEVALPESQNRVAGKRPVRIWSAGCSTGEEPYSIAMVLGESPVPSIASEARVVATDLDTNVLASAAEGVYGAERAASIGPERMKRWFLKGAGALEGSVKAKPELRKRIRFEQLNLVRDWNMKQPFDVIFCRNVVIYFEKPTQRKLFDQYADVLVPGGYLYIGHAETLNQLSERFRLVGKTTYRKID